MADDIGDRVRFASARRPLYDDAIPVFELLNDRDLCVVIGHREIKLEGLPGALAC